MNRENLEWISHGTNLTGRSVYKSSECPGIVICITYYEPNVSVHIAHKDKYPAIEIFDSDDCIEVTEDMSVTAILKMLDIKTTENEGIITLGSTKVEYNISVVGDDDCDVDDDGNWPSSVTRVDAFINTLDKYGFVGQPITKILRGVIYHDSECFYTIRDKYKDGKLIASTVWENDIIK